MEPLEHELAEALSESAEGEEARANKPARVLILASDQACRHAIIGAIAPLRYHHVAVAKLRDAHDALRQNDMDAIIIQPDLADGDATELIRSVSRQASAPRVIALAPADAPALCVTMLLEAGAADVLTLPLDAAQCAHRVQINVDLSRAHRRRARQVAQLQALCRRLNDARLEAAEQLDMLSRDLVGAYQDGAQRINDTEMTTEFRTLLEQELDLEELLRTTLEYLLTKTGPTNAAVYLPNARNEFALGAYVNYDCPRETVAVLLDHLCHAICPQMARESELVSFDDADDFASWVGAEAGILTGSQVVAFSCRKGGDCLAVVVLFRNKREVFADNLASILELLRPVIAEQIAQVIHVHHRATGGWPRDAFEADDDLNHEGEDEGYTGLAA